MINIERKIYEYLPPFNSTKVHVKTRDLLIPNTENVIHFNSEFESGNLQKAIRISDFEYNLYLEFDKNSRNYTQWYYFSCRNVKKGRFYVFTINFRNNGYLQHRQFAKSGFVLQ